jgi:hypothetical protein
MSGSQSRNVAAVLMLAAGILLTGSASASAADPSQPPSLPVALETVGWGASATATPEARPVYDVTLLAKAQPDECYAGLGTAYPPGPPCDEGTAKVNEAYVWALVKTGPQLWFGTAPNVHCLVLSGFLGQTIPHETPSWVCEYGESQLSPPLPAGVGDWRPPRIMLYDTEERTLTDRTPPDPRIQSALGIRSAGALDEVVLLAGPDLHGGIDLFAYHSQSLDYLGSSHLPQYSNIRKWLVVDSVLYTAVGNTAGGGSVLRWIGNGADPFRFQVVGNLDGEGAELAWHEGRIFVSTWPQIEGQTASLAGLYMSPAVSEAGLSAVDADGWRKVWESSDYEPDPVTAATYGGGALASFHGHLYWGTMHVPLTSALAHMVIHGQPESLLDTLLVLLGTHRATSVFRGRDFGTASEKIELLYGEPALWSYCVEPGAAGGQWQRMPNSMGTAPLWGASGFDNPYNNYTWTMAVHDEQLFVGTMDWSYLLSEGLPVLTEFLFGLPLNVGPWLPLGDFGADLLRFPSPSAPAIAESTSGLGNLTNYGIRTMLSDGALYLGSANPMNLLTDRPSNRPQGGWELLQLTRREMWERFLPLLVR